ncbi:MAG: sigma-70 family RNA polymerase sigma factor [Kiritimatiellae bacterium]|nr:sigma-70 family RNA polymerase sigma factor [Kiritimatiellia bacterium]
MRLTSEELNLLPLLTQVITLEDVSYDEPMEPIVLKECKEESSCADVPNIRYKFSTPPPFSSRDVSERWSHSVEQPLEKQKRIKKAKTPEIDFKKFSLEELFEAFYDILPILSERERHILFARYSEKHHRTLRDLAEEYAISHERIRQIEQNALKKLRQALNNKFSEK